MSSPSKRKKKKKTCRKRTGENNLALLVVGRMDGVRSRRFCLDLKPLAELELALETRPNEKEDLRKGFPLRVPRDQEDHSGRTGRRVCRSAAFATTNTRKGGLPDRCS